MTNVGKKMESIESDFIFQTSIVILMQNKRMIMFLQQQNVVHFL